MREAEIPDKRSILRSWLFWGLLSGLTSAAVVFLWLGIAPSSTPEIQVKKAEAVLSPLQALQLRVDSGDCEAQRQMAFRFLFGNGVLRSAEDSKRLYDLSVSGGNAQAMYDLACLHDSGAPGFVRDAALAWGLYQRAAKAGQIDAMGYVSEAYEGSSDVIDLVASYAWRNVAIHLSRSSEGEQVIRIKTNGSRGWMGINTRHYYDAKDTSYFDYNNQSVLLTVRSPDEWIRRLERKLSDTDILVAQKRSKEILKEIEASKLKK